MSTPAKSCLNLIENKNNIYLKMIFNDFFVTNFFKSKYLLTSNYFPQSLQPISILEKSVETATDVKCLHHHKRLLLSTIHSPCGVFQFRPIKQITKTLAKFQINCCNVNSLLIVSLVALVCLLATATQQLVSGIKFYHYCF